MPRAYTPYNYDYPEEAGLQLNHFDEQNGDQTLMDLTIRVPHLGQIVGIHSDSDDGQCIHVSMRGSWEASHLLRSIEALATQLRSAGVRTFEELHEEVL